jgi:Tol biopolymer transport system component
MKKTISLVLVLALALTAKVTNADFTFGAPTNLGLLVNSSAADGSPKISADGLTLYFDSLRAGGFGDWDIWVTTRETIHDGWVAPVLLPAPINSVYRDAGPSISADGLSLYFASDRPDGFGSFDIWVTRRKTTEEPWGDPVNLGPTVNSSTYDCHPSISADGLALYFDSVSWLGLYDVYVTERPTTDSGWRTPVNLGPEVNTIYYELSPDISSDALSLFFDRRGAAGDRDIMIATRRNVADDWGIQQLYGPPVNTLYNDTDPSIAFDGTVLYFGSYRPGGSGGQDLWQAPILPVVDFNGDGIVDCGDMCIMVDHWGTDEPLCDIGPMPWGDGIVDAQDLIVLAEHLFTYPGAVAYWKLDETEGDIAYDSIGVYDAILNGVPTWQPTGGIVDGALEFDGIDDYVSTPLVLNPADGEFSVFAWIKGGAPGQVVISQVDGANWLLADSSAGNLMTELKGSGRSDRTSISQIVITDGNWYRVGLVWDGTYRTLYVDDVAVAEDAQTNLLSSENGLYIGTGKTMEPGSFWSGLIDDVRIYNRAVRP